MGKYLASNISGRWSIATIPNSFHIPFIKELLPRTHWIAEDTTKQNINANFPFENFTPLMDYGYVPPTQLVHKMLFVFHYMYISFEIITWSIHYLSLGDDAIHKLYTLPTKRYA